ncbi:MAG TPA: hypothetical protein VHO70_16750 [Chitinispirillaceae bacterium]|nr:hypothetical protein [Chitinispirillaceae bacterium]
MQEKQISKEALAAVEKARRDLEGVKENATALEASLQTRKDRINELLLHEKEAQQRLHASMNVYETARRKFYEEGIVQKEAFEKAKSEILSARDRFGKAHSEVESARAELSSMERSQRNQGDGGIEAAKGRLWQEIYNAEHERLAEVTRENILRLYAARYKSVIPTASAPDFRQFLEELIGVSLIYQQTFKRNAESQAAAILADYNLIE